jgi:hypothetical protein
MDTTPRAELRRTLDHLLTIEYTPGDEVMKRHIVGLIEQAYGDATEDEWDDVTTRLAKAFGENGEITPGEIAVRPPFESLVTDGVFARYLEWTTEHEAPAQYHFGALLTALAAGLGRRPRIAWEARALYPNLFTLLIGPSGARKGSAMERAVGMATRALGTYRLPNEGTHQGFAEALRRRGEDTGGVSDGLIVSDEFTVLISKDKNKEDLVKWLTDWYDSPPTWGRALRGEAKGYEFDDVYVSVLGGSNIEWLRTMPGDAVLGGFMPRFVLFDAPGKRHWVSRPRFSESLERELSARIALVADKIPETIGWDHGAGRYLDHWYENDVKGQFERAGENEKFKKWLERKQAAAMKIATVWQLVDGGPPDAVTEEWLARARRVVDWGDDSVMRVYGALGVTPEGQVAEDVLMIVRSYGGSAPRRALFRALSRSYTASRIQGALRTLQLAGELRSERSAEGGMRWELVE